MNIAIIFRIILFLVLAAASQSVAGQAKVQIVADEGEAVLALLDKKANARSITDEDWQRIFASEGYRRLKIRELAMSRPFEDGDFKTFALSDELFARREALKKTLAAWREIDASRAAALALAYLPANAQIRAKIYPVIKPRDNSFVFDVPADPAIFLYLDPQLSKAEFENTLAHELHHIGFGSGCPAPATENETKRLAAGRQKVLKWTGAFGEGLAMLAAAGGPDAHPHAASNAEDRARWDRDVGKFNEDLKTVEKFLLELDAGRLAEKEEIEAARSFYGVQGPWYTVGWQMAVVIEKTLGRPVLIESFCDRSKLLANYNRAAAKYNANRTNKLAVWSAALAGGQ